MDRGLSYGTLADALTALDNGARLVATNDDATFPTPDGPMPGAGAIIGAFRGMGHEPAILVGKPSPIPYRLALATLGVPPNRVLMIGDRLETDILGGRNAGIDTAFVLSGISTRGEIDTQEIRPTWIARDLAAVARGDVEAPQASPSSS
jgi:HAD superfamily hydrolase (TIGR01450 family)